MSSNNIQGRFSPPGVSLDRSVPEPKPEQEGLGRLGGLEVGKKEDANTKLQTARSPLWRSDSYDTVSLSATRPTAHTYYGRAICRA